MLEIWCVTNNARRRAAASSYTGIGQITCVLQMQFSRRAACAFWHNIRYACVPIHVDAGCRPTQSSIDPFRLESTRDLLYVVHWVLSMVLTIP